jgi:hypothetical protein
VFQLDTVGSGTVYGLFSWFSYLGSVLYDVFFQVLASGCLLFRVLASGFFLRFKDFWVFVCCCVEFFGLLKLKCMSKVCLSPLFP